MNARVPDVVDLQPVLEEVAGLLLLAPHPQPVRIERRHLRLTGALFVDVVVEQVAQAFRDLVAELDAHTDIRHTSKERLQHRLGLIAVAVRGEVPKDAAQLVARNEGAVGADHDVLAFGKIPQGKQLADCRRLLLSFVLCIRHRHGSPRLVVFWLSRSNSSLAIRASGEIPSWKRAAKRTLAKTARAASASSLSATDPSVMFLIAACIG